MKHCKRWTLCGASGSTWFLEGPERPEVAATVAVNVEGRSMTGLGGCEGLFRVCRSEYRLAVRPQCWRGVGAAEAPHASCGWAS